MCTIEGDYFMSEITSLTIVDQSAKDLSELVGQGLGNEDKVILSMVERFVNNLPYSMDAKQKEYTPADFLYMAPTKKPEKGFFKWEDSVYSKLANKSDTRKSAIIIQLCALFQKMLQEEFPHDYQLTTYEDWEASSMPNLNEREYNMRFFEILKSLPTYYDKMQKACTTNERRTILNELYKQIEDQLANRLGGLTIHKENGTVTHHEGSVICTPTQDLKKMYHLNYIETLNSSHLDPLVGELKSIAEQRIDQTQIELIQKKLLKDGESPKIN